MACNVIDIKCIFVNELVGSIILSIIILFVIYLIAASKLRFGYDTTIAVGIVVLFIGSLALGNLAGILAFATVIIGILLTVELSRLLGN